MTVAGGRDGPYVWMAVRDEGPGIAPEDQARVFERFWKGDRRQGSGARPTPASGSRSSARSPGATAAR